MASGQKVQGLNIKLSADTSAVNTALKDIDKQLYSTNKSLREVNDGLKLKPDNIVLLTQKQGYLTEAIDKTKKKLEQLKSIQQEYKAQGIDQTSEQYSKLERNIEKTTSQLSNFKSQLDNTNNSISNANNVLKSLGAEALSFGDVYLANLLSDITKEGLKSLVDLTKKVASGMVDIVKSGVEYNAQMEQYATSFKAMLGSEEEANKLLTSIKKNASQSPFDTASLVQANQLLLTTGETAEMTEKTINALGDAVAYTGGGNDELKRMASNLQQIKNVGKATSTDIKQFAMAGINVYGILSKTLGKTTDQIKNMDISYQDLQKALIQASSEGGIYFGAMDRQAQTLNGQLNLLQSNWNELTGIIAYDTTSAISNDFLPALNEAMQQVIDWENQGFGSLDEAMANSITDIVNTIVEQAPILIDGGFKLIGSIADGLLKEDSNGKTLLEKSIEDLTEMLISLVASKEFIEKLLKIGKAIGKGITDGIKNKIEEFFDWFNASFDTDKYGNFVSGGVMSGGYGDTLNSRGFGSLQSGGFSSGGIATLNANFTINNQGQPIAQELAYQMVAIINEELGGMV